jgi:hypothetical protein
VTDSDLLDGCEVGDTPYATPDDLVPWVVLFASVMHGPADEVEARAGEWRELFGGGDA